jgi:hypothetical protein
MRALRRIINAVRETTLNMNLGFFSGGQGKEHGQLGKQWLSRTL